jgi:SAM-dependent methyltransferase
MTAEPGAGVTDRRARMLGVISLARSVGLEIGPLHVPLVRRTEGRVLYVDHASAETLRANFRDPAGDPANIVDVDIIWGERPLRDCVDEPVDYVVASHVIEHVPDLIGWLLELHAVLKQGGILGLAVPDRRYTFDVRRPVSTVGELVEAWLLRYRQPSLRQVFDAAALSKDTADQVEWRPGESSAGLPPEVLRRLPPALDMVRAIAAAPRYVDLHCWIFTPASFLDTAEALSRMGCFPFTIDGFFPTEPGAIEFQVRLSAVADAGDPAIAGSVAAARTALAAHAPDSEVEALRRRIGQLEEDNAALRASLATIRRSTSWRLTAPLRSAMHRIRTR